MTVHRPSALVAAALLLLIGTASGVGPTEHPTLRHDAAYGSDDKWWRCQGAPADGCDAGPFGALGLNKDEETFVRDTLDRLPWFQAKGDKAQIRRMLGKAPTIDVGMKETYVGVGPGTDPQRGVSVYYVDQRIYMIHWTQPGRFRLIKAHHF